MNEDRKHPRTSPSRNRIFREKKKSTMGYEMDDLDAILGDLEEDRNVNVPDVWARTAPDEPERMKDQLSLLDDLLDELDYEYQQKKKRESLKNKNDLDDLLDDYERKKNDNNHGDDLDELLSGLEPHNNNVVTPKTLYPPPVPAGPTFQTNDNNNDNFLSYGPGDWRIGFSPKGGRGRAGPTLKKVPYGRGRGNMAMGRGSRPPSFPDEPERSYAVPFKCNACSTSIFGAVVSFGNGNFIGKFCKECFLCGECGTNLRTGNIIVVQKDEKVFCQPCYEKKFSPTCHVCEKMIQGSEKLVKCNDRTYHLEHFVCVQCETSDMNGFKCDIDGDPRCGNCANMRLCYLSEPKFEDIYCSLW